MRGLRLAIRPLYGVSIGVLRGQKWPIYHFSIQRSEDSRRRTDIAEQTKYRIIDRPAPGQVRLIDDEGNQVGVVELIAALEMAQEKELDLVEMNPNSDPPLCKLMDFGKFKYDQSKNSKQVQKVRKIKEVKLRPKTERHDLDVKLRRARNFLEEGHKVLVTMVFRGREQRHPDLGKEVLLRFFDELEELAKMEREPVQEARNRMAMVLAKKK
ncbi:MAG: translation initiation factor IF-3 [Planctomycetota bacterium]|nr:translation initiation factor IF-3 [Planctomycetota bacterium]